MAVWERAVQQITSGELWTALSASLWRNAWGFVAGASAGLAVGVLLGWSRWAERLVGPSFRTLKQICLFAWIPMLSMWFGLGDGAKIGSNAVVIKPVPAGATAVGIPARIIQSKQGASADVTEEAKPKFSAYGITQEDDPLSQAMRSLIDSAAGQEHQIALLWQAIEKLSLAQKDCVPADAAKTECFEAEKLNQLVGK